MAWCPKCKCEYVEGVTECADCGCELEEQLDDKDVGTDVWNEEVAAGAMEMIMREAKNRQETESDLDDSEAENPVYKGRYVNNEEQAEENRSSAVALLLTGGIGLVLIILFFLDLLPVRMTGINKYMVSGVMGTLFVLFFIMGIVSLRNSKILAGKAQKENNLTEQIKKWCVENFAKDAIDDELSFEEEITEEIKYFQRFEKMKDKVKNQFVNLDERYLDRLMDEIYPLIFEDGQA